MSRHAGIGRETIIATAADLSDEEGFDRLTLARVASRLRVRSQSLYAHIESLEELRRELQLRYQRLCADRVRRAAVGRAGRDAVVAIATAMVEFGLAHPGLASAASRPPGEDAEMWEAIADLTEPLITVLRSFGVHGDEVTHWHRAIWIMVEGFTRLRHAGLMTYPADPDQSFSRAIGVLADELERRQAEARSRT